jgi:hypothetical protein
MTTQPAVAARAGIAVFAPASLSSFFGKTTRQRRRTTTLALSRERILSGTSTFPSWR